MKARFENIDEIQNIIFAFANGDFSQRLEVSDSLDERDIIVSGINMLGEELEEKSISKDYLYRILNSIPLKIVVFDINGEINLINDLAKEWFIHSRAFLKLDVASVFPKEIEKRIVSFLKTSKQTKNFEVFYKESNEKDFSYLMCNLLRIDEVKMNHFLFVGKDISEEKKEEKKIVKATLMGQELERRRLANDLHDSLGQELNAIKMYMNAMEYMDIRSQKFIKSLADVHKMLDNSIDSVRHISHNLIPKMIETNDLVTCINHMISQLNPIYKIKIRTFITKKKVFLIDKNNELFIFRVVQEFINNSIKHSKASKIDLIIKRNLEKRSIKFEIRDNGVGFDINKVLNINGINNIKYRLESMNLEYKYVSEIKKGTSLQFEIKE